MLLARAASFNFVILVAGAALAQEPEQPQSAAKTTAPPSSTLVDEESKIVDSLASSIDKLIIAGKRGDATEAAAKLLELKTKQRGKQHFETQDAQRRLDQLREPLRQAPLQRRIDELPLLKKKVLELLEAGQNQDALALGQAMRVTEELAFHRLDPRSTQHMDLLGRVYESLGRVAEAEDWYAAAADRKKEALGDAHPAVAESLSKSGEMRLLQSKYREAASDLWEALRIRGKALGASHPDTAASQNQLANCYHRTVRGKAELHPSADRDFTVIGTLVKATSAESFFKEALINRRRILSADHPDLAVTLHNLATLYVAQGDFERAEPLYQESLKIIERAFGAGHSNTAAVLSDYAAMCFLQEEKGKAAPLLKRAIAAHDTSRLAGEKPSEKLLVPNFDARSLLAIIEQSSEPDRASELVDTLHARGLIDHPLVAEHRLTPQEFAQLAVHRTRRGSAQSQILALLAVKERNAEQASQLHQLLAERDTVAAGIKRIAEAADARNTATVEQIHAKLPDDTALLFWVDVESRLVPLQEHWVCALRPGQSAIWERLPGAGEVAAWSWQSLGLPTEVRARLGGNSGDYRFRGHIYPIGGAGEAALAWQRMESIRKRLTGVKRIYAIPGRTMAGIPLEILAPEFDFDYVLSGSAIAHSLPLANRSDAHTLLAVGDANYPLREDIPKTKRPWGGMPIIRVGKEVAAKYDIHAGDWLVNCGGLSYGHVDDPIKQGMENYRTFGKTVPLRLWRQTEEGKTFEWTVDVPIAPLDLQLSPRDFAVDYHLDHEFYNQRLEICLRSAPFTYDYRFDVHRWNSDICSCVELNKLKTLFGDRGKFLEWSQASEQNLLSLQKDDQLRNFRYLHFATNGIPNNSAPYESYLSLAQDKIPPFDPEKPGDYVNGELSAKEILTWKLDADLVVVSNFKLQNDFNGTQDGMLAMAQAFLTAGARSVLITPCDTNDLGAWLLLDRFYQNLEGKRPGLTEPMKKSAALREAKTWLKSLTHPDLTKIVPDFTKGIRRANGEALSEELIRSRFWIRPDIGDYKAFSRLSDFPTFILIGEPD